MVSLCVCRAGYIFTSRHKRHGKLQSANLVHCSHQWASSAFCWISQTQLPSPVQTHSHNMGGESRLFLTAAVTWRCLSGRVVNLRHKLGGGNEFEWECMSRLEPVNWSAFVSLQTLLTSIPIKTQQTKETKITAKQNKIRPHLFPLLILSYGPKNDLFAWLF